jgi:hypothetical protein
MTRSQEVASYTGAVIAVDPSGRGSDLTAWAIVKYLNGYLFLVDVGGLSGGYADSTLVAIANRAKFHNVTYCVCEPNYGGGMFSQLLTPVMNRINPGCAVEDAKWSVMQKEKRIIDTLEPVLMRHKLIVDRQVLLEDFKAYEKEPAHSLIYQMTRLTRDKGALANDDKIDALALAVDYWKEYMNRDDSTGMEDHVAEQLEKWLDPDYGILYKEDNEGLRRHKGLNILNRYGQ